MASKTNSAWTLNEQNGIDSLTPTDIHIPDLGDFDVQVKIHAASLNYRDIVLAKASPFRTLSRYCICIHPLTTDQGSIPLPFRPGVIPGSDGAGIVEAVGSKVTGFRPGDRVCTHLTSQLPSSKPASMADICAGLGQQLDGTLRTHGVFHETALVPMPPSLDFLQASTLTCSGLTAWNALFGIGALRPKKGNYVLVQGTGGVSIAALQVRIFDYLDIILLFAVIPTK